MYRIPGLEKLADRYVAKSFADKIFFANSGSEAVECGLKVIRKYHAVNGRYRIITMSNGFHGRTLACISAGGNDIARKGYEPLMDGFDRAEFNNLASVEAAITDKTAGILVEPIQGEGGVHVATKEFLQGLRRLSDKHGLVLFFDEVQCGMGRTGSLFAYEQYGVTPDILSAAKGIGNGFPLAACFMTDKVASAMTPGSHGSTYGSNPLAMAVGNAVLDVMEQPGFFAHVQAVGEQLKTGLQQLVQQFPQLLKDVRGQGLMLGLESHVNQYDLVDKLRRNGLLTAPAVGGAIRILPPLTVQPSQIEEGLDMIRKTCEAWV